MGTTGRPSYVFQVFCAPETPVEPNRPPGQLQLLTQAPLAPAEEEAAPLHHSEGLVDLVGRRGAARFRLNPRPNFIPLPRATVSPSSRPRGRMAQSAHTSAICLVSPTPCVFSQPQPLAPLPGH